MFKKTLTISLLSLVLFAGLGAGYTLLVKKDPIAKFMNLAASAASTINFGKDIDLGTHCLIFDDGQQCEPGGGGGLGWSLCL